MTEQWTCGHQAGAACAECFRELAEKATDLAEEVERLRNELEISNAASNGLLLEVASLRARLGEFVDP